MTELLTELPALLPRFSGKVSPAVQVRMILNAARMEGFSFDEAWMLALGTETQDYSDGRVKWPHDTQHRRDWKEILEEQRETWERAYQRAAPTLGDRQIAAFAATQV